MEPCNFIKRETVALVVFCEFCEIFENNFLTEHLCATASDQSIKRKTVWISAHLKELTGILILVSRRLIEALLYFVFSLAS